MTSYAAQVPKVVAEYFERHPSGPVGHPIITGYFLANPRRGSRWEWQISGYKKRVSIAWLRKLKREGVTWVTLSIGGIRADFSIDEILKGGYR